MARPVPSDDSGLRLVHSAPVPHGSPGAAALSEAVPLDDNELLAAVRSGDETAATAFYRRVHPKVNATIARMLGRHDADAEDVAQLALVELVQSIGRFRGECSLDSWVASVTAHIVCKQIRRRRIERGVFEHADTDPADGARAGPLLVARDLLRRIREHLDKMDPDRAWAFLLHDVYGFDLREAAGILEVSVAAAQKRLVRGRRELRERLGADPDLANRLAKIGGETS
ncbi:MAG: RNA polymerase sigma factor [Polyangiaceae bacterium]